MTKVNTTNVKEFFTSWEKTVERCKDIIDNGIPINPSQTKNITIVTLNSKYNKLNKRRQKILLPKLKSTTFTNCYPVSAGNCTGNVNSQTMTIDINYQLEKINRKKET